MPNLDMLVAQSCEEAQSLEARGHGHEGRPRLLGAPEVHGFRPE
jgi:hypothetical protein